MTLSLAVAEGPGGPWWAAPSSALLGIIVGFALKAAFDAIMERRRERREDHLRFVEEKMRAYADLGLVCSDIRQLMDEMDEYGRQYDAAEARLFAMTECAQGGVVIDADEFEDLRSEIETIGTRRGELKSLSADKARELGRLTSLLTLISPRTVRDAIAEMTDALTEEDFDQDRYDNALGQFVMLAGQDLGRHGH